MTNAPQHPAILEKLEHFGSAHLAPELKQVAQEFERLANFLANEVDAHPQLTIALQKLIEAKDAAVRARVAELKAAGTPAGPNTPDVTP